MYVHTNNNLPKQCVANGRTTRAEQVTWLVVQDPLHQNEPKYQKVRSKKDRL